MKNRIYMDHAATTPVEPEVLEAMLPFLKDEFGNPSSQHRFGQKARDMVEASREQVAALLHADAAEIVFTSGGTEADNTAIKGICRQLKDKGRHIITSAVEHHAVLHPAEYMREEGFDVTILPVDETGQIDPDELKRCITGKTILVSIMHANNEVGTLQPVREIGAIARERGVIFHCDAVQSFGHLPINVRDLNIDCLSLSAHKLYGPKGVGALYCREGVTFIPLLQGGSQENGRRSSTINSPGIAGLGKAVQLAEASMEEETLRTGVLRDRLWELIQNSIDGVKLNGHPTDRLPNNLNITIDYVEGESILMNLDLEGIAASSGSACSSGSDKPSHVLTAMGLTVEQARGSLRLTLGRHTTEDEIQSVAGVLNRTVKHLRSLSSF